MTLDSELIRMRRSDRQQDDDWIRTFLKTAASGVIASVAGGQPFLNTNLFVYDDERRAIYFHTALNGRTPDNLSAGGPLCFSASQIGRLLPAAEALEFSVEYASVVVFGRAARVDDPQEAQLALQLLLDKYFPHLHPGQDYRPITPQELNRTAVFRLEIEAWSGKQKRAPDDFPGAFMFGDPPSSVK